MPYVLTETTSAPKTRDVEHEWVEIAGWVIWAVVAFAAYSFWFGIFYSIRHQRPFMTATLVQAIGLTVLLAFTALTPEISKFHLVWAAPLLFYATGFIAIHIAARPPRRRK